MRQSLCTVAGVQLPVYSLNTVVVGTGAAGFNAADCLWDNGQKDIAIVTEGINMGTSRNTGSDKQTYYKISLSGGDPDSVMDMAKVYFSGQCVDGDHALCEAALSAQSFLKLVQLGVPFPRNRYGEYVGYKTDHDPSRRATSIGPYTSKRMTECLEKSVRGKDIPILDHMQVIRILTHAGKLEGILCLNTDKAAEHRFVLLRCKNLVYATGGPAGMYANSVFPVGHLGASGAAFEAGVKGKNLTEWQFGLASVQPRWNVSGTYMQVLPRFISTDENGGDEREFLSDFFTDKGDMLTRVFLKGYQWPFDVRKVDGGSSIVDILVYIETCLKGRRVFLDFRKNPFDAPVDFDALSPEAHEYLEKAGACFGTPIERLLHMNAPAVDFYMDKGVDIRKEPLEIALCAQHNNGGLSIDAWWHTNVEGFFAAGEVSASHGVYRPGGSALNAGQVGSARAAQYIAARRTGDPEDIETMLARCAAEIEKDLALAASAVGHEENTVHSLWAEATNRMSRVGGAIRDTQGMRVALAAISETIRHYPAIARLKGDDGLGKLFRLRDTLISQYVYLSAFVHHVENGGSSRGSALYTDPKGSLASDKLPEIFRFVLDDGSRADRVQEVIYENGECRFEERAVRPIPVEDDMFENVWRTYRENGNIY